MLGTKFTSMVIQENTKKVESRELFGKTTKQFWRWLTILLFPVSTLSIPTISDFGDQCLVMSLTSILSMLVTTTVPSKKDKKLSISQVYYTQMTLLKVVKSWDWSNNISSVVPLSRILFKNSKRITKTSHNSQKRIRFNLMIPIQLLPVLSCSEFWLMRRSCHGNKHGTLFTTPLHIQTTLSYLKHSRSGLWA